MKKLICILTGMFLLSSCTMPPADKHFYHCTFGWQEPYFYEEQSADEEDYPMMDYEKEVIYEVVDNYIVSSQSREKYQVTDEIFGQEKSRVKIAENILRQHFFESKNDLNLSWSDNTFQIESFNKSPQRPRGWRGYLVPEEYKWDRALQMFEERTLGTCEEIK